MGIKADVMNQMFYPSALGVAGETRNSLFSATPEIFDFYDIDNAGGTNVYLDTNVVAGNWYAPPGISAPFDFEYVRKIAEAIDPVMTGDYNTAKIGSILTPENRNKFFFIERFYRLTVAVYALGGLKALGLDNDADRAAMATGILLFLVSENLKYVDVASSFNENAFDDMFRRNVEASKLMKDGSKSLVDSQTLIRASQDNVRKLVEADSAAQSKHWWAQVWLYATYAILGGVALSLVYGVSTGSFAQLYVVCSLVGLAVMIVLTTKGVEKLIDVPSDMFMM